MQLALLPTATESAHSKPSSTRSYRKLHQTFQRTSFEDLAMRNFSSSPNQQTPCFYGVMVSVGWDYLRNYAWRDLRTASFEMFGAVSYMSELMRALNELTRLQSEVERVAWVRRNYGSVLNVFKSLFNLLLKVFSQPGPLKDAVQMVQTEIVDGGLLRDCLELGSNDLKGMIQILKDVALQYSSTSSKTEL